MPGTGTELNPGTFDATGGLAVEPGGRGAPGGNVDVVMTGAISLELRLRQRPTRRRRRRMRNGSPLWTRT